MSINLIKKYNIGHAYSLRAADLHRVSRILDGTYEGISCYADTFKSRPIELEETLYELSVIIDSVNNLTKKFYRKAQLFIHVEASIIDNPGLIKDVIEEAHYELREYDDYEDCEDENGEEKQ